MEMGAIYYQSDSRNVGEGSSVQTPLLLGSVMKRRSNSGNVPLMTEIKTTSRLRLGHR